MKIRAGIVAGTALALVMAAAPAISAAPARAPLAAPGGQFPAAGALLLAQADDEPSEEELRRRQQEQQSEEAPAEQPPVEEAPVEEPPAEEQPPAPAEEPQPEPEQQAPVEEPAPEPEQAPVPPEEPAPEAPAEEAPAEQQVPAEEPTQPEQPAPAEEPTPEQAPIPPEEPAQEAPAEEAPATQEEQTPEVAPVPEEQPAEDATPPEAQQEAPTPEATPVPEEQPAETPAEQPQTETQEPQAQPEAGEAPAPETAPAAQPAEAAPVENEQGTPILDSQKQGNGQPPAPEAGEAAAPQQPASPPPASDREAQQLEAPVEIQSLRQEEGRRIDRRDERRERREGVDVLREIGDRIILQFDNQTIVRSDDRDRLGRNASEVYYEELPRGRSRETIIRGNGVQVVTIRDRYGDVIRRSRITPEGREYVLVYAGDRDRDGDRPREWRDPAYDLPPLHLTIPVDEYILDARRADAPEDYYEFLEQPPVEPVRRLYSIDEVKYSARVRDSVRRVDLDTITFEFGSASISDSEIGRLEGVAIAMERLLDENPAETFLIEGHTDAVGSDEANLALSDRRAESVAAALTNVFDIPPENLVTQGYGESYLKINTQEPERANRRVAMRRITPLVAPVAEAQQ